jgi:hypothetical protein
MFFDQYEITLAGKILLLVIIIALAFGSFLLYRGFQASSIFTTAAVKFEKSPLYENSTGSIRLRNVPDGDECNVFVSGPSKEIKYYGNFSCSELNATNISKADFLEFFGDPGIYGAIVFSEKMQKGYDVWFDIK